MQTTDIELAGAGYMVAPGTYRRAQDGMAEGRTGRVVVRDFFGGQRRALQLERDRSWDAVAVGPVWGGQGVEPWPKRSAWTDAQLRADGTTPNPARRIPHLVVGDRGYVGIGRYLYQSVALSATSWGDFARVFDPGGGKRISGLAYYRGNVAVLLGSGADIQVYDTGTGAASVLQAGEKGVVGVGYAGRLVYSTPAAGGSGTASTEVLRMTTGGAVDTRSLDAPIVQMALFRGKVAIATRQSIWLLGGKSDPVSGVWTSDPEPFFTSGVWSADDDFTFLLSFGGKLYTWLGNQVQEWNPNDNKQGWRATGVEGQSCYGATVAGGYLIVALTTRPGNSEVWAFDGSGWWLMQRDASTARTFCWPVSTGGAGYRDVLVFRGGDASFDYDVYRLIWRDGANASYRDDAAGSQWVSSMLDAGERDKSKAWRKIGATFAAPEQRGKATSADPVTVKLSYSLDGGQAWTVAASATLAGASNLVSELDAALGGAAAVSRWIQLKVEWTSVVDWAPVLTGVWAEYELLDAPAKRRRWSFKVQARDRAIQRDGDVAARSGQALAADLWAAWAASTTVAFKDVDVDVTHQTYQVRIVGIAEEIPKPSDAATFGASVLALTVVEV